MTDAAPPRPRVGFADVIDLALAESLRSAAFRDLFAADGKADIARHHARRVAIFDVIATVFVRIEGDAALKQRLRELAAQAAAETCAPDGEAETDAA